MRKCVAICLAAIAFAAVAQEYQTARVVDAGEGTGLAVDVLGRPTNAPKGTITVDVGGMRLTADYAPDMKASPFVVGSDVQARVFRENWLDVLTADGKRVRCRIVRREIIEP